MIDLINLWLNSFQFSEQELRQLKSCSTDFDVETLDYESVRQKAVSMLPVRTIDSYNISFDSCATNIINNLFKKYVDDDTLVITTASEHPSVKENLLKCKNVHYLYKCNSVDMNFKENLSKFKKAFVFCIGLSVGDSQFTNNDVMALLKNKLYSFGIESVFVLDPAQEIFMLSRDYSLYDYIIGTSHVFVSFYDTGFMFSKEKIQTEKEWLSRGNKYLDILNMLLKHKDKLFEFHSLMMQCFGKQLSLDKALSVSDNAPYVFTLHDKKNRLKGISKINPAGIPDESTVIFRASESLIDQDEFLEKIKTVKYILENS